ncbi:MAG: Fe-S cluster assembly protein NifU [Nitrospira sp.]|nr:Fe-S cluster assembly protein NifU [bacterium]MBL7049125.1 Fe-S cluster assembly protein NifU [Nitrospira sp.]
MWEYTDKVRELFLHPHNVGEIKGADGTGDVGSIVCGDALKLTIKVDKASETITDAKFQTFGCASAIASSSAITDLIIGKTIDEALKLTNEDIAGYLGGLPREKMHCSVMGREALEAAIADYRGETKAESDEGTIICQCYGLTDTKLRHVIKENSLRTAEDVTNFTKAGGGCGTCLPDIEKLLTEIWSGKAILTERTPLKKLTNIQKISMIQDLIEKEIRPLLQSDGGDVELIDVDGTNVVVSLRGMCSECVMADVTLKNIEKKLKEMVSNDLTVTIS